MRKLTEEDVNCNGVRYSRVPEVNPPREDQIAACLEWLERFGRKTKTVRPRNHSYYLKHVVERWVQKTRNTGMTINNGAFIVAAMRAGYQVQCIGGPNTTFNIASRGVSESEKLYGYG